MTILHTLADTHRQSVWIDDLRRSHLHDGTLSGRIAAGVRGLTSNPTIFAKAITGSSDYDEQFAGLIAAGAGVEPAYWTMVVDDIRAACDAFAPLHTATHGRDGFVCVEVSPTLARDTAGTESAARELRRRVDRPNVMIKIPATIEGLPAIRRMIGEGMSVNVTLIFGLERYAAVMEAYIAGLEDLASDPAADLSTVGAEPKVLSWVLMPAAIVRVSCRRVSARSRCSFASSSARCFSTRLSFATCKCTSTNCRALSAAAAYQRLTLVPARSDKRTTDPVTIIALLR